MSCNIFKFTKGNKLYLRKLFSMFFLENKVLKFEYNCHKQIVKSESAEESGRLLKFGVFFNKKKLVFLNKTLHTLN